MSGPPPQDGTPTHALVICIKITTKIIIKGFHVKGLIILKHMLNSDYTESLTLLRCISTVGKVDLPVKPELIMKLKDV